MKKRPLWPLLPPVVVLGIMFIFVSLTHWLSGPTSECGILKFTGLYCAGCGGTRCAQSIFSGHWLKAMGYNPMLMTGFLVFMTAFVILIVRITILGKPAPKIPNIHPRWPWLAVGSIILFTILRNIPAYPFTLLAP